MASVSKTKTEGSHDVGSAYIIRPVTYKDQHYHASSSMSTAKSVIHSPPTVVESPLLQPTPPVPSSKITKRNGVASLYMSLSWALGFREKYSLFLSFIFGGALIGYCLARSEFMGAAKMRSMTIPGEFRWFDIVMYKINYILHIYLSILGGIFVGIQFLPMVRRRYIFFHRLNGYFVIITLVIGNVGGGIIARRSLGGEINVQTAYYILAIMTIGTLLIGLINARRNTRLHRKWMFRGVVYFSSVITAKLAMLAAMKITTNIDSYYSLWRCDEVLYVLRSLEQLSAQYPQCTVSGDTLSDPGFYVSVHASLNDGDLGYASAARLTHGMALWVATLLHVAGVEIYLRYSEKANYDRHNFALEPQWEMVCRSPMASDVPKPSDTIGYQRKTSVKGRFF